MYTVTYIDHLDEFCIQTNVSKILLNAFCTDLVRKKAKEVAVFPDDTRNFTDSKKLVVWWGLEESYWFKRAARNKKLFLKNKKPASRYTIIV